jgi:hypothetical protein
MTYSIGRHTGYEHNRLVAYLVGHSGWVDITTLTLTVYMGGHIGLACRVIILAT